MLKRILFTSIWLNITLKISLIQDPTQALSSLTLITGKRESWVLPTNRGVKNRGIKKGGLKLLCKLATLNPLSANPTKWSNILKQFVDNLPTNCLIVFDHFVGLRDLLRHLNFNSVSLLVISLTTYQTRYSVTHFED